MIDIVRKSLENLDKKAKKSIESDLRVKLFVEFTIVEKTEIGILKSREIRTILLVEERINSNPNFKDIMMLMKGR